MSYTTKICACCRRELPIEEFYKNKTTYDGYMYYCKECMAFKTRGVKQRQEYVFNKELEKFSNKALINELEVRGVLPPYTKFKIDISR